jgi:hypothetical protein
MNPNIVIVVLLVIHFAIALFLLWITFRFLRRFILMLLRHPLVTHPDEPILWPDILISVGIIGLLFRSRIEEMSSKLGDFFMFIFDGAEILLGHWIEYGGNQPMIINYSILKDYLEALHSSFSRNIVHSDFGMLLFIIALFIGLVYVIRMIRYDPNASIGGGGNSVLRNMLIVGITLFSIFLCTASIVAVPEFENLLMMQDKTQLITEFEQSIEDQRQVEEGELRLVQDSLIKNTGDTQLDSLLNGVRTVIQVYGDLLSQYESMDANMVTQAKENFRSASSQRIGRKVLQTYRQRLTAWYSGYHVNWVIKLRPHNSNIVNYINRINAVKPDSSISRLSFLTSVQLEEFSIGLKKLEIAQNRLQYLREAPPRIPVKPDIGEHHGKFFIKATGWLLRTESESLVLIVGMFGFGLFGSIGSYFIRRRSRTGQEDKNPAPDSIFSIADILLNGMSATIVVFLGVKGAVMVFTTNSGELNPYALFFTCLLAAVFSEDVWRWAWKKLQEALKT